MGCGASKIDLDEKYAMEQNAQIEKRIRQDKKLEARTAKILLLGTLLQYPAYIDDHLSSDNTLLQVRENLANQPSSSR